MSTIKKEVEISAENSVMLFSYILALLLKEEDDIFTYWYIMEKGTEKSTMMSRREISLDMIRSAMAQLKDHIIVSPCYKSSLLRDQDFDIYLKREVHQPLQSVKGRGVIYTLLKLSERQRRKGVIAISTGRFAYILCYYGNLFAVSVIVVMPTTVADDRVKKCQDTGPRATLVVHGSNMLQAHIFAVHIAEQESLVYLDGNDHPDMIIGQATLGLEIVKEMEHVDAVILPTIIDDCGLTAGIAIAIKEANPKIEIFEVVPTKRDPLVGNIRNRTKWRHEFLIPPIMYRWHQYPRESLFDRRYIVNDQSISAAMKVLQETECITDYHAAVGLAPIVNGVLNTLKGKRVVIFRFGEMDSATDLPTLTSGPSVPRASPSTSRE